MTIVRIGAIAAAIALTGVGHMRDSAQSSATRDAFMASLENMTDGAWITSNAEYRNEDGGIQTYGMKLDLAPGGLAAVGCLWGEGEGQVGGVFWQLFQAWDPVAEKGMVYQSSPSGAIAIGHLDPGAEDQPELIQTLVSPQGARSRIAHQERWRDSDTRVGGSLDWEDDGWVTRRNYTWVRERNRATPC